MKAARSAKYAALALLVAAAPAAAHTSYMQPNVFSAGQVTQVTIETSFTEDFSRPEIAVESQDFHLYRPNGQRDSYDHITTLTQMTVLESDLTEQGTYRFTTGERLGRTGVQVREGGQWRAIEPGAAPPAGAETRRSQTATVADVYVTKGAPTNEVLAVNVGRLAIRPVTHPSAIYLDQGFALRVTFDGAPVANQSLELTRDGGGYDEPSFSQTLHTDASGALTIQFDRPGVYLLMTRMIGDAPPGAETAVRSYTTSLTFEVTR